MQSFMLSDELKSYIGLAPQAFSGSTAVPGTGIQREYQNEGFNAVLIVLNVGAVTGTPTSFTLTVIIQDSADNSSFATYTPPAWEGAASLVGSAAATIYQLAVDLRGARQYVRVQLTPSFSGGTTPGATADVVLVAGRASVKPAASY